MRASVVCIYYVARRVRCFEDSGAGMIAARVRQVNFFGFSAEASILGGDFSSMGHG